MTGGGETIRVGFPDSGAGGHLLGASTQSLSLPDYVLESETRVEIQVFILS